MSRTLVSSILLAATALLLHPGPGPVSAQVSLDLSSGSGLLVGYVPKPTEQMYGAGTIWFPGGRFEGWGLLVDARWASNRPSSDEFEEGRTKDEATRDGDNLVRSRPAWNNFNAAVVRGVGNELALYAGVGLSKETVYSQYSFERMEDGSPFFGVYWIELVGEGRTEPNVIVGAIYRMGSRIALQMGFQTAPQGFAVGGYLLLF